MKLANDANCFALAETHWKLAERKISKGIGCYWGIIMGSGVGGGIVSRWKSLEWPIMALYRGMGA